MIGIHPDCPPSIALLADHLDAALAAGEDLLVASLPARADLDEIDSETAPEALDAFVRRLLQLEASLLLRVLQARRLAVEIGRADSALKAAGALFRAQTDTLHELVLRAGRTPEGGLVRSGDSHAYLRSRGLIAPEAAAPSPFESISVGEDFRVGGIAVLSQILDLVSSVLDLLDARFGLYAPEMAEDVRSPAAPTQGGANVASGEQDTPSLETVIAAVTGRAAAEEKSADDEPSETKVALMAGSAAIGEAPAAMNDGVADQEWARDKAILLDGDAARPDGDASSMNTGVAGELPPSETISPAVNRSLVSLVAEIGTVS